jgi:hypothetical protein
MQTLRVGPGGAAAIGLLIAAAAVGCTKSSAPHSVASSSAPASVASSSAASSVPATSEQPTTPSAPAPTKSLTATSSPRPTSSGGVQNLVASTAVRSELLTAFATIHNIPVSYLVGSTPGSLYYAYVPATNTYWAMASYDPVHTDPLVVMVSFQDGGDTGLFKKVGSAPWQVVLGGIPLFCGEERVFPQAVLEAWSLPTAPPAPSDC